jgi:hypothetical protein
MTMSTTRRRLLTGGAASLATLGAWSATSQLMGQRERKGTMQTTPVTNAAAARSVERVLTTISEHWVGDGFRVRSVISPDGDPRQQSPFLLLDHAARRRFEPASERRGVGSIRTEASRRSRSRIEVRSSTATRPEVVASSGRATCSG